MATNTTCLFLIGLMLFLSANSIAQKSPLEITGTFVEVERVPERTYRTGGGKTEKSDPYFEVRLRLVYHNRGETTLIVPISHSFDQKKVFFYDIPSAESKITATAEEWMYPTSLYPANYDRTANFLRELARPEPSRDYFTIIEPGGFHQRMETIRTKSGFTLERRENGDKVARIVAIPEHPYFKIRYARSIKDRSESSEPLADAGSRWKQFGKLFLNSDGDFFFETDIIVNKLPD